MVKHPLLAVEVWKTRVRYFAELSSCVAVAALLSACDKTPAPATREAPKASASAKSYDESPRPKEGATETVLTGKVVEKLSHPSYSYLLLDTGNEKVWTAVPRAEVELGRTVTVERAILMRSFKSPSLKRNFDRVYFGVLKGRGGPVAAPHGKGAVPHAPSAAPTPTTPASKIDLSKIKVRKAAGPTGKTVLEVITGATKLAGKQVAVRGVVIKFNSGILGKNWIHLQDGTGKAEDKTNDLTVTLPLSEKATVGETVTVHGKLLTNHDLGSGYHYKALLEGARIERQAKK